MRVEAAPYLRPNTREAAVAPWRIALLPVLVLLGITLPLAFLARVEQYLYYMRPIELVPTYATAWLLLAALSVLPFLIVGLALRLLHLSGMRRLRQIVTTLLLWIAAAAVIAPVLFDTVTWLFTFGPVARAGIESSLAVALAAVSIAVALPLAVTQPGREILLRLQTTARFLAVLGGLSMLSLPFFRWESGTTHSVVSDSMTRVPAPHARPHIVLLTIDALSAQHMSLYGAQRPTTPSLDAFSLGAAVFDRAYANANFTTPGVASILTGTRPWTHRASQIFSWPTVETRRTSLPAELARAGYLTGYVATNSYAGASRNGLGPYFAFGRSDQVPMELPCPDRVAAILPYECPAAQILPLLLVQKLWNKVQLSFILGRTNRHYDPSEATQSALAWLESVDKSRPIFLWLHLFPPHAPYAAPNPWLGRFDASAEARDIDTTDPDDNYVFRNLTPERVYVQDARYDESVLYVDHYAGEFLTEALKLLGDNTVVVVTADHGESFANGYGGHDGPGLYESIIHVPLIIKLPYQTHAVRIATPAEQVDIAPTLAALAGISPPALWEGRSLLQLWNTDDPTSDAPSRAVFAMNFEENPRRSALTTGSVAAIEGRWKLIHYMGALHYPQMPRLHDELYDLFRDPGETTNRASDQPGEVERLRKLIVSELARYGGASR